MKRWVIITGEYPPEPGGVSDYTRRFATALVAAGDQVLVIAPKSALGELVREAGVEVMTLPDRFGRVGRRLVDEKLKGMKGPFTVLVQYVPHSFGMKAMNVPFCWWLWRRRKAWDIYVMFHEIVFGISREQTLKHNFLGWVTNQMAKLVLRSARRTFYTIPAWLEIGKQLGPKGLKATWLPVPSNFSTEHDARVTAGVRGKYGVPEGVPLVGHFGTYGALVVEQVEPILEKLLAEDAACHVLLMGRSSDEFAKRFVAARPTVKGRVWATGGIEHGDVVNVLKACDVLVQPYPDGVSCRRSSLMSGLAAGCAMVTNSGRFTEEVWGSSGAVLIKPEHDVAGAVALVRMLLGDAAKRAELGRRAQALYKEKFMLEIALAELRREAPEAGA